MDILEIIKQKIKGIELLEKSDGIKSVITHIEVAEDYLKKAKDEGDDNLFTDVIYRTNHSFEGILKEAYSILTEDSLLNKSPYEIETYLLQNKFLKSRVVDLLSNYRKEWRNPSTHDHKLFFSEQESFLAIVTVSAFINILIDQMIEKIYSNLEKEKIKKKAQSIIENIEDYYNLPLSRKCENILIQFVKSFHPIDDVKTPIKESQYLGMISGFFASVDPSLKISTDPVNEKLKFIWQPDLIISDKEDKVVIELKRNLKTNQYHSVKEQMAKYLAESNLKNGIVFQLPTAKKNVYELSAVYDLLDDSNYNVVLIIIE